jgi:hypothetical protein
MAARERPESGHHVCHHRPLADGRALSWKSRSRLLLAGGIAGTGIATLLRGRKNDSRPPPSAPERASDDRRGARDFEWAPARATNRAKDPVPHQLELDAELTLEAPAPELLAAALREEDPLSREHVAHELRFRRDDESLSVLLRLLGDEDPAVRGVAAESLAARTDERGVSPLIGALEIEDDDDARGRERAALSALSPDRPYFPD